MGFLGVVNFSSRFLLARAVVSGLVLAAASAANISSQKEAIVRDTESGKEIRRGFVDIPEATEPCSPEESAWWTRIRKAGKDLMNNSDERTKERFLLLLYEGKQKGYRVPLKDRPHQSLVVGMNRTLTEKAQKLRANGTVVLSAHFRDDGSVGEVQIIDALGNPIDEEVIKASRRNVFLPAVRDRTFVAEWGTIKLTFFNK